MENIDQDLMILIDFVKRYREMITVMIHHVEETEYIRKEFTITKVKSGYKVAELDFEDTGSSINLFIS